MACGHSQATREQTWGGQEGASCSNGKIETFIQWRSSWKANPWDTFINVLSFLPWSSLARPMGCRFGPPGSFSQPSGCYVQQPYCCV